MDRLRKELQKHQRERTAQMIEKDNEFHRYVRAFEERPPELHDRLSQHEGACRQVQRLVPPNRIEQSMREHGEMIEALKVRDADAFEKLVVDHLLFSKKSYLERLGGRQRR